MKLRDLVIGVLLVLLSININAQSIVGSGGLCITDANPNLISDLSNPNPEYDCYQVIDRVANKVWIFDNMTSTWIEGNTEVDVEDLLTSTSVINALSANQGRILRVDIDALEVRLVADSIRQTLKVDRPTDIADAGKSLVVNATGTDVEFQDISGDTYKDSTYVIQDSIVVSARSTNNAAYVEINRDTVRFDTPIQKGDFLEIVPTFVDLSTLTPNENDWARVSTTTTLPPLNIEAPSGLWYWNGTAWLILQEEKTDANDRVFAPYSAIVTAIDKNPSEAEMQVFVDANGYKDLLIYYTGDDNPADEATIAFEVDASGKVTKSRPLALNTVETGCYKDIANSDTEYNVIKLEDGTEKAFLKEAPFTELDISGGLGTLVPCDYKIKEVSNILTPLVQNIGTGTRPINGQYTFTTGDETAYVLDMSIATYTGATGAFLVMGTTSSPDFGSNDLFNGAASRMNAVDGLSQQHIVTLPANTLIYVTPTAGGSSTATDFQLTISSYCPSDAGFPVDTTGYAQPHVLQFNATGDSIIAVLNGIPIANTEILACNDNLLINSPEVITELQLFAEISDTYLFSDAGKTTTTLDGGDVLVLEDAAGNGDLTTWTTATGAANSGTPTYIESDPDFNGKSSLDFNGTQSDGLGLVTGNGNQPFSLFAFVSCTGGVAGASVLSGTQGNNLGEFDGGDNTWQQGRGGPANNDLTFRIAGGNSFTNTVLGTTSGADLVVMPWASFADGNPHLLFTDFDGTTVRVYVDGELKAQSDVVLPLAGNQIRIATNRGAAAFLSMKLGKMILGKSLTEDQKTEVQAAIICEYELDPTLLSSSTPNPVVEKLYTKVSQFELRTYADAQTFTLADATVATGTKFIYDTVNDEYYLTSDTPTPGLGILTSTTANAIAALSSDAGMVTPEALHSAYVAEISTSNTSVAITGGAYTNSQNTTIVQPATARVPLAARDVATSTGTLIGADEFEIKQDGRYSFHGIVEFDFSNNSNLVKSFQLVKNGSEVLASGSIYETDAPTNATISATLQWSGELVDTDVLDVRIWQNNTGTITLVSCSFDLQQQASSTVVLPDALDVTNVRTTLLTDSYTGTASPVDIFSFDILTTLGFTDWIDFGNNSEYEFLSVAISEAATGASIYYQTHPTLIAVSTLAKYTSGNVSFDVNGDGGATVQFNVTGKTINLAVLGNMATNGTSYDIHVEGLLPQKTVINTTDLAITNPNEADVSKPLAPNGDGTATFRHTALIQVDGTAVTSTINATSGGTVTVGTGTDPSNTLTILNSDFAHYTQEGNKRYYVLRYYIDQDATFTFEVVGAQDVALVQATGYSLASGGASSQMHGVRRSAVNEITINRDNDVDNDMYIDISFMAIMQ